MPRPFISIFISSIFKNKKRATIKLQKNKQSFNAPPVLLIITYKANDSVKNSTKKNKLYATNRKFPP
jgi:hypothetical protein